MVELRGPGKPLTQSALDAAGEIVGVGMAEMWAVIQIESRGSGYLADRRPTILFERHIFHRFTDGRFSQKHSDISNSDAGGYGAGGAHQYDRLTKALELDEAAALKSASWGLGQVMGFNAGIAGFADVHDQVEKMVASERHQLTGMFHFIRSQSLHHHLKNKDWESFARGYNGKDFAKNQYHTKLENAFGTFSTGQLPDLRVRTAQLALLFLGHDPGRIDGLFGNLTRKALNAYQARTGMPVTADLSDGDLEILVEQAFEGELE